MYWKRRHARSTQPVERVFVVKEGQHMVNRKSGELSPESMARANRRRIAAEEGRQALAEVERNAVAARENMARLRALREAEEMRGREVQSPPNPTRKNNERRSARKQAQR
jgi:hypothetical protein